MDLSPREVDLDAGERGDVDLWGEFYGEAWAGRAGPLVIERDDGHRDAFDSEDPFFEAPRSEGEGELLERIEGPVLDLGGGVGSYALHLQERGLEVTVADASEGALRVARERGCASVRALDLRALDLDPGSYRSVIVMGNTLGAHQTPETLPGLLGTLHRAVVPGGHLLCSTVDPLDTDDEAHRAYHRRNREKGLPPGLVRIRMKYGGRTEDWMPLWLLTDGELAAAAEEAGWELLEERREGPVRVRLFERTDG